MSRTQILVTGANGFIGKHLCQQLVSEGQDVTACIRRSALGGSSPGPCRTVVVNDLEAEQSWPQILADVDAVIHLAARVHVMHDRAADPLTDFRRVNVSGTATLARKAAEVGVRRFIYLSSIKVNGEATPDGAFQADDRPAFADPYGQSKWEAEQELQSIADQAGMEWVVVRPTLVYGPRVRGNFLTLLHCISRRLPVPVPAAPPTRSLVSVYNLAQLLTRVIRHDRAPGERFLVSDSEHISTVELACRIASALDTTPRLLRIPASLMRGLALLPRPKAVVQRLLQPLVVDTRKTEDLLGWHPPVPMDWALAQTCGWYREAFVQGKGIL